MKVASIVFYVKEDNLDEARLKIKTIVDSISQDTIFDDAGLDQDYADEHELLFNKDTKVHTIN